MTLIERKRVVELCVTNFQAEGRSVISHVSCCAAEDAIELCKHAKSVACKGVLILPPFYYHGMSHEVESNLIDRSYLVPSTLSMVHYVG